MALVAVVAACAERPVLTDQTLPAGRCSADGLSVGPLDNDGLPSPVARTRQALLDAAVACDFRAFNQRAVDDATDLRFEGAAFPVQDWRRKERRGDAVVAPLARLLALSPARVQDGNRRLFVWPDAVEWPAADVAPGSSRADLEAAVGPDGVFGWAEAGGYSGWRLAISANGRWVRYWFGPVAGEYP